MGLALWKRHFWPPYEESNNLGAVNTLKSSTPAASTIATNSNRFPAFLLQAADQ